MLVQDYHFALLPRMIRERLPRATIITFWHIPVAEPGGVRHPARGARSCSTACSAAASSASTRSSTATTSSTPSTACSRRASTARRSPSRYSGEPTAVQRYPISIEWPPAALAHGAAGRRVPRRACASGTGLPPDTALGVGVDRLDYTKGIEERFRAVERLLELEPRWIGRFTFVQIAAPTRSRIDEYQHYEARVRALAARINEPLRAARATRRSCSASSTTSRRRSTSTTAPPTSASCQQPARRHEPGGQGVRRRARRRARRADPAASSPAPRASCRRR